MNTVINPTRTSILVFIIKRILPEDRANDCHIYSPSVATNYHVQTTKKVRKKFLKTPKKQN